MFWWLQIKRTLVSLNVRRNTELKLLAWIMDNLENYTNAEAAMVIELRKREVELVLLIGFMKILTPYFVNEFRGRIWNVHPSLLPKYAGGKDLEVHAQVIRNHDKETGCTLHEVVAKVTVGDLLRRRAAELPERGLHQLGDPRTWVASVSVNFGAAHR